VHAEALAEMGSANFLYSDGDALFAHAHWRPEVPGSSNRLPGLHVHACPVGTSTPRVEAPGIHMEGTDERQAAILLASVPLTQDHWEPLPERTLLVLRRGEVAARLEAGAPVSSAGGSEGR
jgi:glutamine amidotransferase